MPGTAPEAVADEVERAAAERIAPPPDLLASVRQLTEELVRRVEELSRQRGRPVRRALVAGSAARETFLRDRLDIDLFLLYPKETPRSALAEEGLVIGRALLERPEQRYAEHPYLRGLYRGFRVEVVPGYAVDDPSAPMSAVDRTPFHLAYLRDRLRPEHVPEVRLAKQFCRRLGILGSEARVEGFSGYLLELLILRFGRFRGLLHAAQDWRIPVRLDPAVPDPPGLPPTVALVVVDPVDPGRNVASAVSRRSLATLVLAARAYLDRPSREWFGDPRPARLSRSEAEARRARRGTAFVGVTFPRPADRVDDVVVPQLRKTGRSLAQALERAGFGVIAVGAAADERWAVLGLELSSPLRSPIETRDGPPVGPDRAASFLERWNEAAEGRDQGPYVRDDGTLAVDVRIPDRTAVQAVRALWPTLAVGREFQGWRPEELRVGDLSEIPDGPAGEEVFAELWDRGLPWTRWL